MKKHPGYLGYNPSLDGLRALAVMLVMFLHAHFQLGKNGQSGVFIFFTLSGFLITTLLLEEYDKNGKVSLFGFYIRRTMRLFPPLFAMLIIVTIYAILFVFGEERTAIIKEIAASALYVNNIAWCWGWGTGSIILGHTWSLAVEEQFYIIWPSILLLSKRFLSLIFLQYFLILYIVTSLFLRYSGMLPDVIVSIFQESIFIGCLGAIMRWRGVFPTPNRMITFIILVFIFLFGVLPVVPHFPAANIVSLLSLFLIVGIVCYPSQITNNILSNRFLVFVGKISYSLYLWHLPVFRIFAKFPSLTGFVSFTGKFAVSFLLAGLSYYLLEKRAIRIGRMISDQVMKNNDTQVKKIIPNHELSIDNS